MKQYISDLAQDLITHHPLSEEKVVERLNELVKKVCGEFYEPEPLINNRTSLDRAFSAVVLVQTRRANQKAQSIIDGL